MYENMKTPGEKMFQAVLILICVLLAAICVLPLINIFATSTSSAEMIMRGKVFLIPQEFNLEAYNKVFASSSFLKSFGYTVYLTLLFTLSTMIMTILCAYPLSRSSLKGKKVIMMFIVFTMYFNAGTVPNYLVIRDMGLLDKTAALVLPGLISAYNMIILKNFFTNIDSSILESASIDGCNEFQLLTKIVLPLSTAVLATLSLFYAVSRWNNVTDAIYYITDPNKYPLQSVLKEIIMSDKASQLDPGQSIGMSKTISESVKSASIILSTLPILLVYPFIQKYFTKGIMIGSVKG